ncbi:hypothetical protein ACH5RR_040895 [Cinchona calisaya]|uniref:G protein gamma domain-containing protein n=1 Tax=Cinchona calisaya TaxID=153742 RepID=A0ABD2XT51_9GENT
MDSTPQTDSQQNTKSPIATPSSSLPISTGGENRHEPRMAGFMGKHRMAAAVAYLDQQIQIIQEELDQLETLGESSIVCRELVTSIESVPDALLPVTKGPLEIGWDRWFQGGHGSRARKRWI